jgi:hypothetical protein
MDQAGGVAGVLELRALTGIEPEPPPRKDHCPLIEAWPGGYEQGAFRVVSGG